MIYRVVTAPTVEALEQEVNRLMEGGWAVIGGLGVVPTAAISAGASEVRKDIAANVAGYEYQLLWAQAMITEAP